MKKLEFRLISQKDQALVDPMVVEFYGSDAVDHPVAQNILDDTFRDVADPENDSIVGYLLYSEGILLGYCYLTSLYSCEVGGKCVMIEEIFLNEASRGKGYGQEVMELIKGLYPEARRFRLELTEGNQAAKKLYSRNGYKILPYQQMTLDI